MQRSFGTVLITVGAVGIALMLVAAGVTIHQSRDIGQRAEDVLVPLAGGIEGFEEQLDAVERLVDQLIEVVPTENIVELAAQVSELTTRLESLDGYLDTAKRAVVALDGIPFLPVDLGDIGAELDSLEAGLVTLTSRLDELASFVLANQDVPAQIAAGIGEATAQVRIGLANAQAEVVRISDAVDRWLLTSVVTVFVLLSFGVAGQVALIRWGREKRREDGSVAATTPDG